jgi:hypothetical protein
MTDDFKRSHRIGEMGPIVDGYRIELLDTDGVPVANFLFAGDEQARRAHKALQLVMNEAFVVTGPVIS